MWHGKAINFGCCLCELLLILHPKIGGDPITNFKNVACKSKTGYHNLQCLTKQTSKESGL